MFTRKLQSVLAVVALVVLGGLLPAPAVAQQQFSQAQLESIGRRIWRNEAAGKVEGLTDWNTGENFASLGIGHFIWYPVGVTGPFEESFPRLLAYFQQSEVKVPQWLVAAKGCPWPNRQAFMKDRQSARMQELRQLLAGTVALQTQFIIQRLREAAPKMQAAAGPRGAAVARNMQLLSQTPAGNFAMIDYVNFKGEGLSAGERYNGHGWGLLQVLEEMQPVTSAEAAPAEFARASKAVLRRRVQNSPPARNEKQWLAGWLNRCDTYAQK